MNDAFITIVVVIIPIVSVFSTFEKNLPIIDNKGIKLLGGNEHEEIFQKNY